MYNIDTIDKEELISQLLSSSHNFSEPVACLPYVLMCSVPILDFETAWNGLSRLALLGNNSHAAMWMSYIHTNHFPLGAKQGDFMASLLEREDAILKYSMASYCEYEESIDKAKELVVKSKKLQPFPNNVRLCIRMGIETNLIPDVFVKERNYTLEGIYSKLHLYESYLRELITGEYVTKEAWDILYGHS